MNITTEQIEAIITAIGATDGDDTPEVCRDILYELAELIQPDHTALWDTAFSALGSVYQGFKRFDIIYAILHAFKSHGKYDDYMHAWTDAVKMAKIHPLSIGLCSHVIGPVNSMLVFEIYNHTQKHLNHPNIKCNTKHDRHHITIKDGMTLDNLLSTSFINIKQAYTSQQFDIGSNMIVSDTQMIGNSNLTSLGFDNIIIGSIQVKTESYNFTLDKSNTIASKYTLIRQSGQQIDSSLRNYDPNSPITGCGFAFGDNNFAPYRTRFHMTHGKMPNPIIVTKAWAMLYRIIEFI